MRVTDETNRSAHETTTILASITPLTRGHESADPDRPPLGLPLLSLVIPLRDEAENLPTLYAEIASALAGIDYEIVFVDDGSRDGSRRVLRALYRDDPRVRVIGFRRNFGKTAALAAGFQSARGELIATLDADLQDDPAEIPSMINQLDSGADLVAAWRSTRHDPWTKRLPSRVFNWMVASTTGIHIHDFNCGLKLYRREVTREIKLYGDLHRFIPVLAHWKGYRVTEMSVEHRPRLHGQSKYGFRRFFGGLLDFAKVLFLTKYLDRPLQLFGWTGLLVLAIGVCTGGYLVALQIAGESIGRRPLLTLCILLIIAGIQLISTGLIGEMIRHVSFRSEEEYSVDEVL
jgi:glycosyltransferase involved in cell wall biosynthesis